MPAGRHVREGYMKKSREIRIHLLKLLDIKGSTVTTDAIGTQTQIISREGHFVLMVKKNQPQSYEEVSQKKRNRDRQEYRWYSVCRECSLLTKTQKEWPFVKTVGLARQIRIPVEKDAQGNDITPDMKTFLEKGSRQGRNTSSAEFIVSIDIISIQVLKKSVNKKVGIFCAFYQM